MATLYFEIVVYMYVCTTCEPANLVGQLIPGMADEDLLVPRVDIHTSGPVTIAKQYGKKARPKLLVASAARWKG